MDPMRRMPGGVVPRPRAEKPEPRRRRQDAHLPPGAPFDPAERPLGMIHETWVPKEEPVLLSAERSPVEHEGSRERIGPSLTVWIILVTVVVVVVLAVISYRNAPP